MRQGLSRRYRHGGRPKGGGSVGRRKSRPSLVTAHSAQHIYSIDQFRHWSLSMAQATSAAANFFGTVTWQQNASVQSRSHRPTGAVGPILSLIGAGHCHWWYTQG
jgi:hypothetical protein